MNKDKRYRDKLHSKGLHEVRGIWAPITKHSYLKEMSRVWLDTQDGSIQKITVTTVPNDGDTTISAGDVWCDFYPNKEEQ